MPVTWDDVEYTLWPYLGRQPASEMNKIRKVIDGYVLTRGRQIFPQQEWFPGLYANLRPGESDGVMRRCRKCGVVKKLDTEFARATRAPLGRRVSCLACAPARRDNLVPENKYWCRRCQSRKPLGEFPAVKQVNPRILLNCTDCGTSRVYAPDIVVAERGYWCPGCRERKPLAQFPDAKRENTKRIIYCNSCVVSLDNG